MKTDTRTRVVAKIENNHLGLAETNEKVNEIFDVAEIGDNLRIDYNTSNGLSIVAHGEITEVDEEFGDIRFGDNYFHFNTKTGDYYFQDGRRRSPEDGYMVTSVTLYR